METRIYTFSGRGNSLSVALALAGRLDGAAVTPMASGDGDILLPGGCVGLALPVIDLGIPSFVRRFIRRLKPAEKPPYLFAVVTCGGFPCDAMGQLRRLLEKQGLPLSAGWVVRFGLEPLTDCQWQHMLDEMAATVREQANAPINPPAWKDRLLTGLANPLARLIIPGEDRKFRVDSNCDGCGVCAHVCPANNIILRDNKPQWQHRCQQCAACFSWCPKQAISGACLAAKTPYRNPRVGLAQMTSYIKSVNSGL